ncbi:putative tetratricopeptide-like helical domain superfamily [Helianthus debilis subsp. tardiflorus]
MLQRSAHDANTITFVPVLSACSDNKNFNFRLQVHGLLVKVDLVLDLLLREIKWSSMISGMMLNGESESAIGLFVMLESNGLKSNSATWNIMINGLLNVGKPGEAFLIFRKMQSNGEPVSTKSLTSLLSACASVSSLASGKEIHGYVNRKKYE